MIYKERIIHGQVRSEHFVQLFDSQDSLASSVSAFLAPAHLAGENLLIAAKPRHWDIIARGLKARGCDLVDALKTERIVALDAATTARAVSRNQMPDATRFAEVVGRLVRKLSVDRPLAIYGEAVEVLAEEGNLKAAVELEELWNGLSEQTPFRLMCGYSSAHFAVPSTETNLHQVCKAHTHVQTKADDSLGSWLIQRTRLPHRSEAYADL